MRYQGGKWRIAKPISNEILRMRREQDTLVSLFCGSCAVEILLASEFNTVICNDNHKYLIALLKGVRDGYELPDRISEEEYQYIKNHQDEDEVLTGFVGFGCSFGGKWWGGYARYKGGKRVASLESKRGLMRDCKKLKDTELICMDYKDVVIPDNSIIYADPPYENTTKYSNNKFDNKEFWEYARTVSEKNLMFVFEQNAPDDFISVWEKPVRRVLDVNGENWFEVVEKLFIHKKWSHQNNANC